MHEASIADAILQHASAKLLSRADAVSVSKVRVELGEFRNVDPESLQFAFDNMRSSYRGTSQCELEINFVSAKAVCQSNGHTYHPDFQRAFCCETCGSGIGRLLCGEELNIVSVRIETNNLKERANARVS